MRPTPTPVLAEDHHVHSTFSDDATSSVAENISAARSRGLHTLCLTDHVRSTTTWVDEFVRTVREAAEGAGLEVMCGVEVKMLDSSGRLDLPPNLPQVDRVLIADHQYPGPSGPLSPTEVRWQLSQGELNADDVVETVVLATAAAMRRTAHPQLAHLFSLLPKMGLNERAVGPDHLRLLADAARDTGAVVEVNEKWGCPGPLALAEFIAAGVAVVPSTDSHRAGDVGDYRKVSALLAGADDAEANGSQ